MRIIKVFKDFVNEELSPLTIYKAADKFKKKGHVNRSNRLTNFINDIFTTSQKYNVYNIQSNTGIHKVFHEIIDSKYTDLVFKYLLKQKDDQPTNYYPLTFHRVELYTGHDIIEDQMSDCEQLTIVFTFTFNDMEYIDIVPPIIPFVIDVPIWWDLKTESFKIHTEHECKISNEWMSGTTSIFYDRKSANKFKKEVLLNLKDIFNSFKTDEKEKYIYDELFHVFGDFSTIKEIDVMFNQINKTITINDLYKD